jgi:hypothetical protein
MAALADRAEAWWTQKVGLRLSGRAPGCVLRQFNWICYSKLAILGDSVLVRSYRGSAGVSRNVHAWLEIPSDFFSVDFCCWYGMVVPDWLCNRNTG